MSRTYQQGTAYRVCKHCSQARDAHSWNGTALDCPTEKPPALPVTVAGYDLPPGYSLHSEGDASAYWWTYIHPTAGRDPECDPCEHETPECAQLGAWMHHAAELRDLVIASTAQVADLTCQRDALRKLVLQARGAWVRDISLGISRDPTHADRDDAKTWVAASIEALADAS